MKIYELAALQIICGALWGFSSPDNRRRNSRWWRLIRKRDFSDLVWEQMGKWISNGVIKLETHENIDERSLGTNDCESCAVWIQRFQTIQRVCAISKQINPTPMQIWFQDSQSKIAETSQCLLVDDGGSTTMPCRMPCIKWCGGLTD